MTRYIPFLLTCLLILTACGGDNADTDSTAAEATPEAAIVEAESTRFADAPLPVTPTDDTVFPDTQNITLKWEWHRPLTDDEFFDVRVWQPGEREQTVSLVTERELDVSDWLHTKPWGIYLWSVTTVKGDVSANGDPSIDEVVSPNSPIRRFIIGEIDSPRLNPVLVEQGEAIYNNGVDTVPSCLACHTEAGEDTVLAPALIGQWERMDARDDLLTVREYVYQSLINPNDVVPEGYSPNLMYQDYGTSLTEDQLNAVVEYTLSLAAE